MKSKKIPVFNTKEDLVRKLELTMPDEYPHGYAVYEAEMQIKEGKVIIRSKDKKNAQEDSHS